MTATLPGALLLALGGAGRACRGGATSLPLVPLVRGRRVRRALHGLGRAELHRGARRSLRPRPCERCFLAGRIVWFYLGKLVWPADLAFIYPRWSVAADWAWSAGAIGLAAVGRPGRRSARVPGPAFCDAVLPRLGSFPRWGSSTSIRSSSRTSPTTGSTCRAWGHRPVRAKALAPPRGAPAGSGGVAGTGGKGRFCGRRRRAPRGALRPHPRPCALYRDVGVLYSDTLSKDPGCWMAHNNLGVHLMEEGSLDAAISHLKEAVRLKPDYSEAHNNLGNALAKVPGQAAGGHRRVRGRPQARARDDRGPRQPRDRARERRREGWRTASRSCRRSCRAMRTTPSGSRRATISATPLPGSAAVRRPQSSTGLRSGSIRRVPRRASTSAAPGPARPRTGGRRAVPGRAPHRSGFTGGPFRPRQGAAQCRRRP